MLSHEINVEDSGCLLSVLNRATLELMSLDVGSLGSQEWKQAHRLQRLAFARWVGYILKDPVFDWEEVSGPAAASGAAM
jgi:hypothetical protein